MRNPVVQFLAAGFLVLVVINVGSALLSQRAASEEAVADSLATTQVLAHSVAEPAIPRGLVAGRAGALDRFDRTVLKRLLVRDVKRIKIWTRDGRIVYSDENKLIGSRYRLGDDELAVLKTGVPDAEESDLSRPENRFERGFGGASGLFEVYTRVRSPEHDPLLFEAYYSSADLAQRRERILGSFRPITLGGLLLFLVLTTPLVWVLTRRLRHTAEERERLLRAAVDASDSERRRIARDLHDGVVQDLAGTSFALAAEARLLDNRPDAVARMDAMSGSLRKSLRSLRSLLVEIYPPNLQTEGLAAALEDLVAPAAGAGVKVTLDVDGIEGVSDDEAALVWRVAQEAVRNALRHGRPSELIVRVGAHDARVTLEVIDDGVGFEPASPRGDAHFGLRGLKDLIHDAGGRIDVQSAPGEGTTVRLEVAR
jgi:signal transduction histidine kinase